MKEKEIIILGAPYRFVEASRQEDATLYTCDGYVDRFAKTITVNANIDPKEPNTINPIGDYIKHVKRHEIVHAYFEESGLREYSNDEKLVEWIAWHFTRMLKTVTETEAL